MFAESKNRRAITVSRAANTDSTRPLRRGGVLAGTQVETESGWVAVETVEPGQRLQTLDGGLRPVVAVTRHSLSGPGGRPAHVIRVPGGVLDTCSDLTLLADQRVLMGIPQAEALVGTPLVLVPAAALVGWKEITLAQAPSVVTGYSLRFEDDEVVYANTGALLHCPSPENARRCGAQQSQFFEPIAFDLARSLLGLDRMGSRAPVRTTQRAARGV